MNGLFLYSIWLLNFIWLYITTFINIKVSIDFLVIDCYTLVFYLNRCFNRKSFTKLKGHKLINKRSAVIKCNLWRVKVINSLPMITFIEIPCFFHSL